MARLDDADHARLAAAIRRAEGRSRGEVFVVVAGESDDYRFVTVWWAAVPALLLPGPLLALTPLAAGTVWALQAALFVLLVWLAGLPRWRARLAPRAVKDERVRRRAHEQFLAQNVHRTEDRTGVLLYLSLAEHQVELVADAGIDAHVAPETWQAMVDDLVAAIRAGDLVGGLERAVDACADVLAAHLPAEGPPRNALPDHVVEL